MKKIKTKQNKKDLDTFFEGFTHYLSTYLIVLFIIFILLFILPVLKINLSLNWVSLIYLIILAIFLFVPLFIFIKWGKSYKAFFYAFVLFFMLGLVFINMVWGLQELDLILFDDASHKDSGRIICVPPTRSVYLQNEEVHCKLKSYYDNNNNHIHFYNPRLDITLSNGSEIHPNFKNLSFIAPAQKVYLYLKIDGSQGGINKTFSVGYPYEFLSQEKYDLRIKEFIFAFLALMSLILFQLPSFILNMKEIFK